MTGEIIAFYRWHGIYIFLDVNKLIEESTWTITNIIDIK